MLATPVEADFSWGFGGPWNVHTVEVGHSDDPLMQQGTYCYLTNKGERTAISFSVGSDGIFEVQAWLNNIDMRDEADFVDIYLKMVSGPREQEWKLEDTAAINVSNLANPGEVYFSKILDENFFDSYSLEDITTAGLSIRLAFMRFMNGTLFIENRYREKLAEFSLENTYNAMVGLMRCAHDIKAKEVTPPRALQ